MSRGTNNIPDEYPARPSSMLRNELHRLNSKIEQQHPCSLILLSAASLAYGIGFNLQGPLFPREAMLHEISSCWYGAIMSVSSLTSVLFYPIACKMVVSVSSKQSISTSLFIIGVCRVLFGTLDLMSSTLSFITLSFGIQIVEGLGVASLLASSYVTLYSQTTEKTMKSIGVVDMFLVLGLCIGPIPGEAVFGAYGFSIPFYGVGALAILVGVITAILLPEPDRRLTYLEIPVLSWMKESRMLIYFFVVFTTFNYIGFLAVVLEPYLRQFHMNKVFLGALFSTPLFICGISAPAWKWITKKGVNSVLLITISSIFIFASLILIGPAPFTSLNESLLNASIALILCGLGSGGKLASAINASTRDIKTKRSINDVSDQLIIPTMFAFGCLLGYSFGCILTGFADYYLETKNTTYIFLALEAISAAITFVFAFKRNYRSPHHPSLAEENQPILEA